jgi:hypothetical protein
VDIYEEVTMPDDLLGAGKALEKLIDVCAVGLGAIAQPWLHKRRLRAEAQALVDANKILTAGGLEMAEITSATLGAEIRRRGEDREAGRLLNLLDVTQEARALLPSEVENEPVAPEWAERFFEYAQDVSTKELRTLWARILAREVATPTSTSLRTLERLRTMTAREAAAFRRVCGARLHRRYMLSAEASIESAMPKASELHLLMEDEWSQYYRTNVMDAETELTLQDSGLLRYDLGHVYRRSAVNLGGGLKGVSIGRVVWRAVVRSADRAAEQPWTLVVPLVALTAEGAELASVCGAQCPVGFEAALRTLLAHSKLELHEFYPEVGNSHRPTSLI